MTLTVSDVVAVKLASPALDVPFVVYEIPEMVIRCSRAENVHCQ